MKKIEILGVPSLKKGYGIHIKKKNRGKFTEYCDGKVTQKCIDKAKKSGNKTLVKRATFAENARKWKHQKGGQILKFQNSGIIEIKDNVPIIIDEQPYEEPIINYPTLETPDWPLSYALNKNPRINHFKQLDNRSYIDESSPHTWLNSKHRWEIFRQNYADWKGIPVELVSLAESNKELGNLIYNSLLTPSYILDERSDYAEYFKQNPDAQGVYNPNDKEIIYRHATSPAKYGIHERMHAALAKALEYAISKIIPKVDKYLDSGKEVYARLMELRKAYGIHPSKVWNLDDIKNLQKNATDVREGSSGHYDILNRYSPEQILLLFNNIAQNKSSNVLDLINPSEGLTYAKRGNKLMPKENGHRSILDNDWIPTKELKKKHKLVSFNETGTVKGGLQPSRNWDETLAGKLINYSENPDSVGWDAKRRRWYAPPANKGYDTNQFGMGVDRNQTEGFAELVKKDNKGREYLTEEDERYLRHLAIDKANDSANARYKYAQKATGIKGGVSPKHDAITISAIYNLGSGRVARTIFENMKAMKALFDRNSDAYLKAVHEEYRKKDRNERIENELEFFDK